MTDSRMMIPAWVDGALAPVDKIEVHRRGLRHPAVSVMVLSRGHLLMQRRAAGKYHSPGLWANTCCTHPQWGEEALTCAIRRLREELGISGLAPQPRGRIEYRADVGGGMTEHEVVDLFVAETAPGLPLAPDPAEVSGTRWIALDDLAAAIAESPAEFTPWLRIYMQDHRAAIGA